MASRIPQLTYAIGDIHGYDDLFERLLDRIRADAEHINERPRLILLGDYIDRGPSSRQVLERIRRMQETSWCDLTVLMGNHEDALLRFLSEPEFGHTWRIWGGAATLRSYGVNMPILASEPVLWEDVRKDFVSAVDPVHVQMLRELPAAFQSGDYLFVHAGVDPEVPLSEQGPETFMFIRGPFQRADKSCEYVVVHGHTPEDEPANLDWRICVDTGVYFNHVLTAVRLHGHDRSFLQVS